MVDQAFDALTAYDWGDDRNVLNPIDEQIVATHGDAAARVALEKRLSAVLETDVTHDAKQFVCRKLRTIGTSESVPALAKLLPERDLSHMARYALEDIPAPEAAAAMRDALPNLNGALKVGVIASLGVRQDGASVQLLAGLLGASDANIARAAAFALGAIRSPEAAAALSAGHPSDEAGAAVADALLACSEGLLADGKKVEALEIYRELVGNSAKIIQLAATRGILACAGGE